MNKCSICNVYYEKASTLAEHLAKDHQFKPTFNCKKCNYNTPSLLASQKHNRKCGVVAKEAEIVNISIDEDDHDANNQISNHIIGNYNMSKV